MGTWLSRCLWAAALLGLVLPARSEAARQTGQEEAAPILAGQAIWAQGAAEDGVVGLFRRAFFLDTASGGAQLAILADTRYEAWLDGQWLGRGPARFSRVRQEFDSHDLGSLQPGWHTLAVLVQYAPNVRRSESQRAALQASVRCLLGDDWQVIVGSDSSWRSTISPAWNSQAGPVSRLSLIGPMEILDLNRLPANWMEPGYDDRAWLAAVELEPSPFPAPRPRSIPTLAAVDRVPVAVVETGLLSPGWRLIDIDPAGDGSSSTYSLALSVETDALLKLEAIEPGRARLDGGQALEWLPLADPRRPDLLVTQASLSPGSHTLAVEIPAASPCLARDEAVLTPSLADGRAAPDCTVPAGRSLAVWEQGLRIPVADKVQPGPDPGRRSLLANPVPGGSGAPQVSLDDGGAQVYVPAAGAPRYLVLDLGRTVHGRLLLEAEGPAGTIIDAGWDERLTEGRALPAPGSLVSNLWSQVDSWVLDGTRRRLTTIDARAGRYLLLQVWGTGPVWLHGARVEEEILAVEQIGSFQCSDPLLDQVWQVGVDTVRPNMTDAYTDTPWRERGQWWADAMIAYYANRAAFGDLSLLLRGLRQMADGIDAEGRPPGMVPNWPGGYMIDFGLLWIEGLHDYWRQSGDLQPVSELEPAARRLMAFLASLESEAGLMYVPPAHWSQSALVDWSAGSSRSGESTALNAQYAAALAQMGELAQALGQAEEAQDYAERSAAVRQAINDVLFLPEQGCYAASRLDGQLVAPAVHAQAWALRSGVVPFERRDSTAHALAQQLVPFFDSQGNSVVEPPGMFATLEGLAAAQSTNEALALIRSRYGEMLSQGATTWWELYTPRQTRGNSLSHAWGSSPTWFLSSHVLGALATGPASWRVAPHPGDLRSAQGSIPLLDGSLQVAWQRPACGKFSLSVTAPKGTVGQILLPVLRTDAQVRLDETVVWDSGPLTGQPVEITAEGLLISEVGAGSHDVQVSFACLRLYLPLAISSASDFWHEVPSRDRAKFPRILDRTLAISW